MKAKVYIETSFASHLTALPSADIIQAARQLESQRWWDEHLDRFEAFASEAVIVEASRGDASAAKKRLDFLKPLPLLRISPEAEALAQRLLTASLLPPKAAEDALHIAICADNGMDYLLTWNCKHLANAAIRRRMYLFLEQEGIEPPEICTPTELMEK